MSDNNNNNIYQALNQKFQIQISIIIYYSYTLLLLDIILLSVKKF